MTPRPANSDFQEAKRTRIIQAAAAVFAAEGFERASNRAIAEQAGISSGLIYWYFENKRPRQSA